MWQTAHDRSSGVPARERGSPGAWGAASSIAPTSETARAPAATRGCLPTARYGTDLPAAADQVRTAVIDDVTAMTVLTRVRVNVLIDDLT